MGQLSFLQVLALAEEYAFRICEAIVFLTFLGVYVKLAVRHLLALGRKDPH
jgi:hypothetical protein